MTDIEREFVDHGRFERVAERSESADGAAARDADSDAANPAFAPTTNDWDAIVEVRDGEVDITVVVPTLDAVVREEVADVVEDGWYDTFDRRVRDADSVTLAENVTVPDVSRENGEITVELTLTPRPGKAADDALALVNYVEGTWFEGIIPGYDYVEEVQELRERAAQHGETKEGTPL